VGISSDGLVWFGVASDDESRPFDEDVLASLAGIEPNEDGEYEEIEDLEEVVSETLGYYDCELVTHCSYDYPMYGIALKSLRFRAWRGYPMEFTPKRPTKRQIEKLKQAMEAVGWEGNDEPGWQLASLLG
jgi:hypothetical protein